MSEVKILLHTATKFFNSRKMKEEPKRLIFGSTPIILLLILPLICVGVDFVWGNTTHFNRWTQYFSSSETDFSGMVNPTVEEPESLEFLLSRLVRGKDRRNLEATGFACDKAVHSVVCVANQPVRIDTSNMTVYVFSDGVVEQETVVRPYARQEDDLKVMSHLSDYEVMNPAANGSVHCFPGSVVGLKYHDNLALNSSDIPGGHSMREFRHFLREAYGLRFRHVSQIKKPRLMLLSRRNTRRFLNEDEMVTMMGELGFQVIVVARSKLVSNLNKFSQLINSCSVMVGAHGAGLTNELFLPSGAVMVQVEILGTEWPSNTYYGNTARPMGVHYLRYKIEPEESTLLKLYGRNHSVIADPGSLFRNGGYRAARTVFLDQQNVRINLARFRNTLVEALSLVTDSDF
ncbi:unnamed protein product [Fraxinus pennsylvanica]|uniref:Glycosyltransferase 61 catalytic domain-containing protein n=1 Tax=Fraxinus pennsylvanica TaxID=56036 RepID=A0AAD1YTA4_9LAMI|nr:unnamed protein product [Fraxinus pennsylvanica]